MTRSQRFDIYVAGCVPEGGIYHYRTHFGEAGELPLELMEVTQLDRPMFLAIEGDRMYAVLRAPFADSPNSGVLSFPIGEDGRLGEGGPLTDTGGVVGCHISRYCGECYVANYVSGSVFRTPDLLVAHEGSSTHPKRQTSAHTHFVRPTPDGKYVFAVDLGMDKIVVYDKDLKKVSEASVPAGNGARHVAFSPDGKWAYCACELSSSIAVFTYADGVFTFVADVPALPEAYSGESTAAAIRYFNGMVAISHRGADVVSFFRADGASLIRVADVPSGGGSPRDFDFFGGVMIVTNESGDLTVFEPADDGSLFKEKLDIRYIGDPLCVVGRPCAE